MKTTRFIQVLLVLFLAIPAMGQQVSDKKKQESDTRKKKEQMVIIMDSARNSEKELQKAMEESLVAQEKALKAKKLTGMLDDQAFFKEAEALQNNKRKLEQLKSSGEDWTSPYKFSYTPPMRYQNGSLEIGDVYGGFLGNRENTSLTISKTLEDVTFSTDFFYDVKKGSSNVSFYVSGTLTAGELKITLKKPDKTAFQEITISPLADVNWNQQFKWEEDESDAYLGKWIISISASKANGNYRVQVNSR